MAFALGNWKSHFVSDFQMIDQYAGSGTLWTWGSDGSGALGAGPSIIVRYSPAQTATGGTNWKQVSGGVNHGAAIKTDGTLWVWGYGPQGQMGNNNSVNASSPIQTVAGGTNWKQVDCGSYFVGAIKTDGTLWMWGRNDTGQLGINSLSAFVKGVSSPVQTVAGGNNWKLVSCGNVGAGAIKTDGTLWMWGANGSGNLGDGTSIDKSSPVQTISGGTNWRTMSCGNFHTAAIKTDGTLWSWGHNFYGQLGTNNVTYTSSPVQIFGGGTNWKQVSSSNGFSTIALKTDGTLWSFGENIYGKLGVGNTTNRSSPTQVFGSSTEWRQVAMGNYGTMAVKKDGTLWTWGNYVNANGSSNISSVTPRTTNMGGYNWKQVAPFTTGAFAVRFGYTAD